MTRRLRIAVYMLVVLGGVGADAQSTLPKAENDSLWAVWNNPRAADTLRLSAMYDIVFGGYLDTQPDSAIHYAQRMVDLAGKTGLKNQMARALNLQGQAFKINGELTNALDQCARGLKISEEIGNKQGIASCLHSLGSIYRKLGDHSRALAHYTRSLGINAELGNKAGIARTLNSMGSVHREQGDQARAIEHHLRSLKIEEELGNRKGIARSLNNIGIIYQEQGDHARAIEHYTRSLRIQEELGNRTSVANALNNIGTVYREQGDPAKAMDYFTRSLKINEELGDQAGIASSLNNIGLIYSEQGDHARALDHYTRRLRIEEELGNRGGIGRALNNIGDTYREMGDHTRALDYYARSLRIAEELGNKQSISVCLNNIALSYQDQGDHARAVEYGGKGMRMAQEAGRVDGIMDLAALLYRSYKALGRTDSALSMHESYISMRDSIRSKENQQEIMRQEFEYDYAKKALADSLAHAGDQRRMELENEASVARERDRRNIFLFSGIGALLVAGGLWNRLRFTRRAKAEADRLRWRAEASERSKQQFLANMSHEIRTPMNAIMGMTGILKRNEQLPQQKKYLDAIAQSSENLLVILNDILDLGKLEAGKIDLERVPFDPRQVIGNVRDILRFKAEEKGIALGVGISDDVPRSLQGDPTRLNQIVLNLVGNAIKFTERGSVTIRVRWTATGELVIDVFDTGIGIPQDGLDRIFEEFTQAYSDTTRKYGGTGLGLTISKRLAEMQGGSITVKSEQGKGSTFTVTVPYAVATSSSARQPTTINRHQDLRDLRILLAEDNDFNAMVAQDELADAIPGVQVDVAANGKIAVEMAQANTYDLILMDVQMPEMNGYDATRAIQALRSGKSRIPIIAMTANVMTEELERCQDAGMTGHVPKPFKREELMEALHLALDQHAH